MLGDSPSCEFPSARPSKSAQVSFTAEMKRIRSMTIEERVIKALSLRDFMDEFIEIGEENRSCNSNQN